MKSVVNPPAEPAPTEVASCDRGRGQTINEKLKAMATMGPAASLQYTREVDSPKKPVPKKPTFLTGEEQEARKRWEERKNWVMNHQRESVGEH